MVMEVISRGTRITKSTIKVKILIQHQQLIMATLQNKTASFVTKLMLAVKKTTMTKMTAVILL